MVILPTLPELRKSGEIVLQWREGFLLFWPGKSLQ